jgi:hypothetical protein
MTAIAKEGVNGLHLHQMGHARTNDRKQTGGYSTDLSRGIERVEASPN